MDRWSVSVTWMAAEGRISFAEVIFEACRVVSMPVPPRLMLLGPAVSSGRESRQRQGGVWSCVVRAAGKAHSVRTMPLDRAGLHRGETTPLSAMHAIGEARVAGA